MHEGNPLSSADWHRVAGLRPSLASHVTVSRTWVRGQCWHVLHETRSQQSCRLNDAAYAIAARLDGLTTVEALWQMLDRAGDGLTVGSLGTVHEPPSQDEIVGVLHLLQRQGMLAFEDAPDFGTMLKGSTHLAGQDTPPPTPSQRPGQEKRNLLAWRMPLADPDHWLNRHTTWARRLFSSVGLLVWSCLMVALVVGLALHLTALNNHASQWMHTPRYLLLSLLLYPCIKALHEMGHALAVKRWGGAVHEVGLTWMMLMPVPYVNASASHAFPQAWQRAVVSAAGIQCELALAAVGLWVWQGSEPGLVKDLGFIVWFIGCASTLLFNANPLQRLDGYHLMTEALHLPNLAMRSRQAWQTRLHSWLKGEADHTKRQDMAPEAAGEHHWLLFYAPLAWAYQLALWTGLCWWAGSISSVLGWGLAAISVWTLLLKPLVDLLKWAWQTTVNESGGPAGTAGLTALKRTALAVAVILIALLLPWPDRTVVQGVIWAPEEALIRSEVEGLVATVHVPDGQAVQAGDLLLSLHNPQLSAQREHLAAQLSQAEQGQYGHLGVDSAKAGQASEEAGRLTAQLARVDEQIGQLQIKARRAGRLVWPEGDDLQGRYARRGQLLGQIIDSAPPVVKLAVAQSDVSALREQTRAVSVRLRAPDLHPVDAALLRDAVGATQQLPSPALSQALGGDILTDPQDEQHLKALRPVVLMEVQLGKSWSSEHAARLGERAWVRLDHGWSPPIWQFLRWVRHRALLDFNPAR